MNTLMSIFLVKELCAIGKSIYDNEVHSTVNKIYDFLFLVFDRVGLSWLVYSKPAHVRQGFCFKAEQQRSLM